MVRLIRGQFPLHDGDKRVSWVLIKKNGVGYSGYSLWQLAKDIWSRRAWKR